MANRIRVLVVDDSVFARKIVSDVLAKSQEIEIIGSAVDGKDALNKVKNLKPDVITMDVEMPELNGLETLKRVMSECPTPVVMLSSLTVSGAKESIQALRYGAVDLMAKPHGSHSMGLTALGDELISKVVAASKVDMARMQEPAVPKSIPKLEFQRNYEQAIKKVAPVAFKTGATPVVVIASSTGGPRALRTLVPDLTSEAGVAYVIIQHLPEGFSAPLAADLNNMTDLNVREASEGDVLNPGDCIFAKAGYHMIWDTSARVQLTKTPPLWGVRPSADVTMVSAASIYKDRLVGVVLTGMGRDGADGLVEFKKFGATTLSEHESSCVVYGMPRAAFETGCVDIVVPLNLMAEAVNATVLKVAQKHGYKSAA